MASNDGFETAGATPGAALSWTFETTSSIVKTAGFDSATEGIEDFEEGWALPARQLILTQTDTAAACGFIVACSGAAGGTTTFGREIDEFATPGVGTPTFEVDDDDVQAPFAFQTATGIPGKSLWPAGDYTVRVRITTPESQYTLDEIHICRVNSSCVNQGSVASLTGIGLSLSTTGVETFTVTAAADVVADITDSIYIVFVIDTVGEFSTSPAALTPDQDIDTPFGPGTETNSDALFVLEAPNIAFSLFGLNKTAEDFEDAWNLPGLGPPGDNSQGLLDDFDAITTEAASFDP